MSYEVSLKKSAIQDQTVITLSMPYSNLTLTINDIPYTKDASINGYTEQVDNTLLLTNQLNEYDMIRATFTPTIQNAVVIAYSSKQNSLFKYYAATKQLSNNQNLQVNLKIKPTITTTEKVFTSSFVSACSSYFTTIKKIRQDTGTILSDFTDQQINMTIYIVSKEATECLRQNFTAMVQYNNGAAVVSYSLLNITTALSGTFPPNSAIPPFLKQWVRYKSDIDLVNAVFLSISGRRNEYSKKIGPIEIQTKDRPVNIENMIQRLNDLFLPVDEIMQGNQKRSTAFTRAGTSNPYPFKTRVF